MTKIILAFTFLLSSANASFKVSEVHPGSIYHQIQIHSGDVIHEINGNKIKELHDMMNYLWDVSLIKTIRLKREGKLLTLKPFENSNITRE